MILDKLEIEVIHAVHYFERELFLLKIDDRFEVQSDKINLSAKVIEIRNI